MKRILFSAVVLAFIAASATTPAYAYLDPNTGGMLFQFLAVIFSFLSAVIFFFSRHIRLLFAQVRRRVRELRVNNSQQ